MLSELKSRWFAVSVFAGLVVACPLGEAWASSATTQGSPAVAQVSDTAIVRLKITGMT